jgi:hypothetical protein
LEQLNPDSTERATFDVYRGIAVADPQLVADGLTGILASFRRNRWLADEEKALCLEAHRLYGLCEWLSPELVSMFDTTRSLPWDAAFHDWVYQHDNLLTGLNLNDVSPILHEAIVMLRPPDWWLSQHDHP